MGVLNIVHVTAEVAPFSQSGGLGVVASALPVALAELGPQITRCPPQKWRYGGAEGWVARKAGERKRAGGPVSESGAVQRRERLSPPPTGRYFCRGHLAPTGCS